MPKKKRLSASERREILAKNKKILKRILKYKTRIIGLDVGTNITGLYSNSTGGIAITGNNNPNRYCRIEMILSHLEEILSLYCDNKSIAIIEDYSFNLHSSSIMQIAELTGSIKLKLLSYNIPFCTIAPQTLKKYVLGPSQAAKKQNKATKRRNQKQFILLEVLDRWGIKCDDDNIADALCLFKFLEEVKNYLIDENNPKIKKWEKVMFDKFITDRGLPQTPSEIK